MKYDIALMHLRKCDAIMYNINNEYSSLTRLYREIGAVFYNQAQYDKALQYYIKAIELAHKVHLANEKLFVELKYGLIKSFIMTFFVVI